MGIQTIEKREAALDSFVQTSIDRLVLGGLGLILFCAVVALILKATASLLWSNSLLKK